MNSIRENRQKQITSWMAADRQLSVGAAAVFVAIMLPVKENTP
jgi:hypothetical protein